MTFERVGILAAGNWIVDHVKMIESFPEQDALVSIVSESDSNGGGPYNVLKDLAKLGARFPLAGAGLVGDDADGVAIFADCDAHGIDRTQIFTCDAPTSYTDVMTVVGDGRRTFFHQRGANALFDGGGVEFGNARIFYLGYLLLLDAMDEVRADGGTRALDLLRRASEAGCKTAVDLVSAQGGRFREVVVPALVEVDYLFLNEYEAGALLGRELDLGDGDGLADAAGEIFELGVRELVIVHWEGGAFVSSGESCWWSGSVKLPGEMVAGAVGAGDAFAAGMLMGLHDDKPVEECLMLAVCAAAACVRDATTSGGVGSAAEVLELGERLGLRN